MTTARNMLKGSKLPFSVDEGGNVIFTRSLPPIVHSKQQRNSEALVMPNKDTEEQASTNNNNHDSYRITESQDSFHLSIDLPGVRKNDLSVRVANGLLHVEGLRHYVGNTENVDKVYNKTFCLDANAIDVPKLSANLSDGVLVVSAPKVIQEGVRSIPVTQHAHTVFSKGGGGKEEKKTMGNKESSEIQFNHWGYQH